MKEHENARDAASEALIALRKAMGKNQAAFAVEVMRTAVTTIARYETTHPPRGDVLLQLAKIAEGNGIFELSSTFRLIFIEQMLESLRDQGVEQLVWVPAQEKQPGRGYLLLPLDGPDELDAAQSFLHVRAGLRSGDPDSKKASKAAVSSLHKAAQKVHGDPMIEQIQSAFRRATGGPQQ